MDLTLYQHQAPPWNYLLTSPAAFTYPVLQENYYVHRTQTAESHIYSADLPGVRKEEIKVEVEDSRYLIIRTEAIDESTQPAKTFMRKFWLLGLVDVDGISAGYERGVSTVIVPRSYRSSGLLDGIVPERLEHVARAA